MSEGKFIETKIVEVLKAGEADVDAARCVFGRRSALRSTRVEKQMRGMSVTDLPACAISRERAKINGCLSTCPCRTMH
jgi:hypothetical protein